jgi:hypothetical protein
VEIIFIWLLQVHPLLHQKEFVQQLNRFCKNLKCNKQIINQRKDANHCSKNCAKYTYKLKNIEKFKQYFNEYNKVYIVKNADKLKAYRKEYNAKTKDIRKVKSKIYRENNKELIKQLSHNYHKNNADLISIKKKVYREQNKDKIKATIKNWYNKNYHRYLVAKAKRRALLKQALPKFADLKKIREIYKDCPKGFHVDHIIPLNSKLVCGLHVEWNLQYLPAKDNLSKSNKLI